MEMEYTYAAEPVISLPAFPPPGVVGVSCSGGSKFQAAARLLRALVSPDLPVRCAARSKLWAARPHPTFSPCLSIDALLADCFTHCRGDRSDEPKPYHFDRRPFDAWGHCHQYSSQ